MQRKGKSKSKQVRKSSIAKAKAKPKPKKKEVSSESEHSDSMSIQSENEIVYARHTYLAFVDPSISLDTYQICQITDDLREEDKQVDADVFEKMAALTFKQIPGSHKLSHYQIICDVKGQDEERITGKGRTKKQEVWFTLNKTQDKKVKKLMKDVVQKIYDFENEDEDYSDESESESDESEDLESESDLTDNEVGKKDSIEEIKQRRFVKVVKKEVPVIEEAPSTKRKSKTRSQIQKAIQQKNTFKEDSQITQSKGKKSVKAEKKDVQMSDNEHEEEKGTQSKGKQAQSQIGKKRLRNVSKKKEASQQSDEDQEEESYEDSPTKKRKGSKQKSQKVKSSKKPKQKKMPVVFKLGKWNPDIELVKEDRYLENNDSNLILDCCIQCSNKNAIRAAQTGNKQLLKKCISQTKKISSLLSYWSPEVQINSLDYMIKNNDHEMMEILLHPQLQVPAHSNYKNERSMFYNKRVTAPGYLFSHIDTGMVSNMAYGTRVRKVQATRGNRQGNNAFLEDSENFIKDPIQFMNGPSQLLINSFYYKTTTLKTYENLIKLNEDLENQMNVLVFEVVRAGNRELAYDLISRLNKFPNWGFNQLHADSLNPDYKLQDKLHKASITKKANTNKDITPLHCACINPNENVLKQLLNLNNEITLMDAEQRRLVHYAAACPSSGPLQVLIDMGASLVDYDNKKVTCLHVAAMNGCANNVRLILTTSPNQLNFKNKKSKNAMAYACKRGHIEVVKVLLEFKAKINSPCGINRMPPLVWAAAYGHYELCEYLLENKARVLSKDKYKRTALTLAVRNGFTKIVSLLLQRGSAWDHNDSSMNTPLHYAAAYGWMDCIDLLLKTGADVNGANSWKITAINIAMMKNHKGCVKRLLNEENVDVNCKDDKGRTLLMLSMFIFDEESVDFVKYLLQKGANPNIADLEGQASLHYIAKQNQRNKPKDEYEIQIRIQKQVVSLLLENGADLMQKNVKGQTAFALCLESNNAPILEFLQNNVSLNKEPELFHAFKRHIFNEDYQKILMNLFKNDQPTKDTVNYLDDEGLTPFLSYIYEFSTEYNDLIQKIQMRVNAESVTKHRNESQYKISNFDLFDPYANTTNFYQYNQHLTEDEKQRISLEFLDKIVMKPFITLLEFLVKNGSDPQAQVSKLKRYRELETTKKRLREELQNVEENIKNQEEKDKKRDEILKEMKDRDIKKKKPKKSTVISNQDVYEKRNNVKVLREYGSLGLRNAIHLIINHPQATLVDFLLKSNINPDVADYDEITPFNLLSKNPPNNFGESNIFEKLIKLKVRIDHPDIRGRTPFLNYYDQQNLDRAYQLLDKGANVNQMDKYGLFALKYALIRRNEKELEKLLQKGANINTIDHRGRNLLHHAINMSSATADATFETEQFLIDKGIELNLQDDLLRTPLHYAFVKIDDWANKTQIDPIESVSSLYGQKGLLMDIPDKWLKTPLHYAAQRGSSVCSSYLITRDANAEKKDIYGNTPLGVGLISGHFHYCIILIEKGCNVKVPVFREDYQKLNKQWKEERKLARIQKKRQNNQEQSEDVQMSHSDSDQDEDTSKKKHRHMFDQKNHFEDSEDDYESYESEDSEDVVENRFNQQSVFGQQPPVASSFGQQNQFGQPLQPQFPGLNQFNRGGFGKFPAPKKAVAMKQRANYGESTFNGQQLLKEGDEGVSMFKIAIRGGQQGLAYLILDKGYDLMLAMQDSMDEKKFLLVLTLLSKNPNDDVIQQSNSKGQNLFHILSMNAGSCSFEHLERIYQTFLKRGVKCQAKDSFNRTALHYAVISQSEHLVKMLLQQSKEVYNPNEIDMYGHSPLSLFLKGKQSSQVFFNIKYENIFMLLVKHGADVNILYPEGLYKPAFKEEDVDDEEYKAEGPYYCTPLINVIRASCSYKKVKLHNLQGLFQYGAKLDITDSDGRDIMMHAIIQDKLSLAKYLIESFSSSDKSSDNQSQKLMKRHQDKAGRSAAHYVVNPIAFGTFENLEILKKLHEAGYDLSLKDNQAKAPIWYAQQQESGKFLGEFINYLNLNRDTIERFQRAQSQIAIANWPKSKVDFEADAETFMLLAKEREEREFQLKDKKTRVPVDSTGRFESSYEVFYSEDTQQPWDAYLTKVDLQNGVYGDYLFYRMQLLFDSNRELYVVFTRWGRIGETGMNQRTPFGSQEEAKEEFKKIFKQKSGGNNFEDLKSFVKQKKKYNLTMVAYSSISHQDYLSPFDIEKAPKTALPKAVFDLYEEISNVSMYQKAMQSFGIDKETMPISGIKKEQILKAKLLLSEIKDVVEEDAEISKQGIKADFDKLREVREKISELTSQYYELVPLSQYKNQIAPPLRNTNQIKQQFDVLENLTNIEYASRLLLAALYKQKEINPIDYIAMSINLMIENLEQDGPEFEIINQYIKNTKNSTDQLEISNIFKIQRKSEAELMTPYKDVPNHFLLFHGSMIYNFLGILSQGLKIAPPEAPRTGYMFGKGVYFADTFDKSKPYASRGYAQQDSYLMLLCEVALGNSKELYEAEYIESLEPQYQSVKGVGRSGPNYKHTVTLPNGVKLPYGQIKNYYAKADAQTQRKVQLQSNEFIVYNTNQIRMRYIIQFKRKNQSS